jgi:peptidyl-prolyl cis-trans isomerase SurA
MKRVGILFLVIVFAFNAFSQTSEKDGDDAILMKIGNKEITRGEFVRIYNKNNSSTEQKSVDEYLTLFENFKLKVIEAESLGYDTLKNFKREFEGYIKQLEKPYFTDSLIDDKLRKEAIERSKYDVRVKHILIKIESDASPTDTLKVYNKMKGILNKLKVGADFDKLSKDNSEDTYSAVNGGDLGYFTVFNMVYPFESAAYETNVGEVSNIFRTKFGYHILKVVDKRAAKGSVKVAHIMVAVPNEADAEIQKKSEEKINNIYAKLQAGEDFSELADKYSDDKGSAKHGGELNWFGTGKMVPEFESAAFSLKNKEDYTKPIKTSFGWHIIKLIDTKAAKSMEEQQEYVLNKISKDARMTQSKEAVIERLKKEYNYKAYTSKLKPFFNYFDAKSRKEYVWEDPELNTYKEPLIEIGDSVYTQADFVWYMRKFTRKYKKDAPDLYVYNEFKTYSDIKVMDYERSKLKSKYPDYKYLVKEYHDGILLFDLTDKMVWSKAVKDTSGLQDFYEKNNTKYMWGKRVEATFYEVPEKYFKKASKIATAGLKSNESADDIIQKLSELTKKDTLAIFKVDRKKLSKGDNEKIDEHGWTEDLLMMETKDGVSKFVTIGKEIEPSPKELDKVKGLMTADYQNYLEEKWIKVLRDKYKITVNKDVLKTIK